MMNPFEIIKTIRNPKQQVIKMSKNMNNPILNNAINLAQQGKNEELEQVARNIFKEKGIDFDNDIMPYLPKK